MSKIIDAIVSARWIIVVALTFAMVYCVISKIEINETLKAIYGIVVTFYFAKQDPTKPSI